MSEKPQEQKTDRREEELHLPKLPCVNCGRPTILRAMKGRVHEVPKCWPCQIGVQLD